MTVQEMDIIRRELAVALKKRDEARAKQPINTHIRLWDLVRYARAELHEDDLITDQEYADLCMGTKADQKLPGSPSPRRLEDYDDMRKELAALRQQLAGAEEAKGEIHRIANLCLHQNNGRWNPEKEHELRARNILERVAHLTQPTAP